MVSFEIFVKSMPPSLSELKVIPSFCFAFKIPDDVTASSVYHRSVFKRDNNYCIALHCIAVFCLLFIAFYACFVPFRAGANGV